MLHQRFTLVLYICYSVALFCVSAQFHDSNENNNGIQFMPAYAIASRADFLGSATCGMELRVFRDSVDQRKLWGLKSK